MVGCAGLPSSPNATVSLIQTYIRASSVDDAPKVLISGEHTPVVIAVLQAVEGSIIDSGSLPMRDSVLRHTMSSPAHIITSVQRVQFVRLENLRIQ